jgi:hypothetical protein
MKTRIQLASQKGCDGIDPDNVDGYVSLESLLLLYRSRQSLIVDTNQENNSGFGLTQDDFIDFLDYLSSQAHAYNLSIGLKNASDLIANILPEVQFSVNEQCVRYNECPAFASFIGSGKPVFHIEYPGAPGSVNASTLSNICSDSVSGSAGFSTVMKTINLDGWVEYCNGDVEITPLVAVT